MSTVFVVWCFLIRFMYLYNRLDGKHVVFGNVVEGQNVVQEIERVGSTNGKTSKDVAIANCGQL